MIPTTAPPALIPALRGVQTAFLALADAGTDATEALRRFQAPRSPRGLRYLRWQDWRWRWSQQPRRARLRLLARVATAQRKGVRA